jgi:4-diphosphocytidyl-2-C-methyl-D-erythritol kinase
MIVFPTAKINIGLHVVSRRLDGYHNLETLFYPVELSDALEMAVANETRISLSGWPVEGPPQQNLVLKAFHLLKKDFDLPPVQFHLHKVIPTGAGLGGGSSDAASTLKMLNDFFQLRLNVAQLKNYAARLGADCPFFIENRPAFATGIGDRLSPVKIDLSNYRIVVLKPEVSVSTAEAYKNIIPAKPEFNLQNLAELSVSQWKETVVNDFEKSVFRLYPQIEFWKEKLYELGAEFASMSGSGSAVFGIFRHLPTDFDKTIPRSILFSR